MQANRSYMNRVEQTHRALMSEECDPSMSGLEPNHRRRNSQMLGGQGASVSNKHISRAEETQILQQKFNQLKGLKLFSNKQ